MISISTSMRKLISGLKYSGADRPDIVSRDQWDVVPEPAINVKDLKAIKSGGNRNYLSRTNRHTDPYILVRYAEADRKKRGVGHYPLREKWACKPSGMAVSLPHLKCMEEPVDETHKNTINPRSKEKTDQD